ncbi:MAG: hypothetical protein F6J86_26540 [Symploca sp. SIO1B1]|nr:hypothetical protein [Symploca sp. SIO1B1]
MCEIGELDHAYREACDCLRHQRTAFDMKTAKRLVEKLVSLQFLLINI